jgi:hypothetical protein
MKHLDHGSQMLDLLHGDAHGDAESWLRSLLVRRFAPRGHREHGGLNRPRRHLARWWSLEESRMQHGQSGA